MMFIRDYLRVLIPLLTAFLVYQGLVVPWMEPKQKIASKHWQAPSILDREDWWDVYFPKDSWQRNSPRVVKTANAILLFQTREQKTPTRWQVKPLTILIPQRESGTSKRAIVIKNTQGADIEFKSEVDWTQPLPPVVGGILNGEIEIDSPPDEATNDKGMRIVTRDVLINKRQIEANKAITIEMGNSIIEGRNLSIILDKDLLSSDTPEKPKESPFNGLDRLELTYVDRVHIGLDPGGLWPNKEVPDIYQRPAFATLKCKGSFGFNFHQSRATFKNAVHLEHVVAGLSVDTFDCEELQIQIGQNHKQGQVPQNASSVSSNWQVERLEALGAPGRDSNDRSKWIKLVAPGMKSVAEGQHLDMDLVNGTIFLSNRLPHATAHELANVYLRRESTQIWAPEVQYVDPRSIDSNSDKPLASKKNQDPNRLGAIQVTGAGRAQLDIQGESWRLFWGKQLRVRPDPNDRGKELITIDGSANVSSSVQGRFTAEQLSLWLNPTTPELEMRLATHYTDGQVPQFLPDRMKADGGVEIDSPQLRAASESMLVWFAYPTAPAATTVATDHRSMPTTDEAGSTQVATENRIGNLNLAPSSGIPAAPLQQPMLTTPKKQPTNAMASNRATPLRVTARTVNAKVLSIGNKAVVEVLDLEGNVTLTKDQLSDNTPWPFTATGDRLSLSQGKMDTNDIIIVGQPAKVAVGSGWAEAAELKLLQSENQFWIDHPGEFVIPVEAMQQKSTGSAASLVSLPGNSNSPNPINGFVPTRLPTKEPANTLRWQRPPRIQWGKRMTFDGKTARFGGGVSVDCRVQTDPQTLWHISAISKMMAVDMDRDVPFRNVNASKPGDQAQVSVIRLEDSVEIHAAQTDLNGVRRSLEHLKLPQLDILVPSQTWIGHGPGELWSRRLGNSSPMGSSFPGVGRDSGQTSADVATRTAELQLQCIHLSFIGKMEGSMPQRQATFYDRIEALIGPIASWGDVLNVHLVNSLGRNQSLLVSDQLSIFDASGLSFNQQPSANGNSLGSTAWNVAALGRVQMQSNTDKGIVLLESERLAYAAESDTVRIEGTQRQPAVITVAGSRSAVTNVAIRLKTGEFEGQISRLEGELPQNFQPTGSPQIGPPQIGPPPIQAANPNNNKNLPNPRDNPFSKRGP